MTFCLGFTRLQSVGHDDRTADKPWYWQMHSFQFCPRDLITVLKRHKNSLEFLRLDFDDDWQKISWKEERHEDLPVGNLPEFEALDTLDVSQQALLGLLYAQPEKNVVGWIIPSPLAYRPRLVDVLPPNIGKLTMRYCGECINDDIEELSRSCLHRYPKVIYLSRLEIICLPQNLLGLLENRLWKHLSTRRDRSPIHEHYAQRNFTNDLR